MGDRKYLGVLANADDAGARHSRETPRRERPRTDTQIDNERRRTSGRGDDPGRFVEHGRVVGNEREDAPVVLADANAEV